MKRTWTILLVLLLLATPPTVQAQFDYATNNGAITLLDYTGNGGAVVISNFVTSIGDDAFDSYTSLTSITIPNSVTNVGNYAFDYCTSLGSFTIPSSVTSIGDYAFGGCTGLTGITIPNSVTSIGANAFGDCSSLTGITVDAANLFYSSTDGALFDQSQTTLIEFPGGVGGSYTIPGSVTNIGEFAFYDCSGLTNVTIGVNITEIGTNAFAGTSLTSVTIPNSVSSIGGYAFAYCSSLTNVTIGTNVASIGDSAFSYCTGLTSVTIPASVTNIGLVAFDNCTSLTSINVNAEDAFYSGTNGVLFDHSQTTLIQFPAGLAGNYTVPGSVINIGEDAFYDCSGLTFVTIPASVTNIAEDAFGGCANLSSVYFLGNAPTADSSAFTSDSNASAYYMPHTSGWSSPYAGLPAAELTGPDFSAPYDYSINADNTVTITGYAGRTGAVNIPDTINGMRVTSIGDNAFGSATLTSVTIPGSVTSIGDYAFTACFSLTNFTIGTYVASIGTYAFGACTGLTSVTIPASVTNIGLIAFDNCTSLTSINVNAEDAFYSSTNGVLFDHSQTTLIQFPGGVGGSYTIPGSVTNIGDLAFDDCARLTGVTIPDSVANIGIYGFAYCTSLTGVYFLSNAPTADSSAFTSDNNASAYYLPGASGWSSPYAGIPAVQWMPGWLQVTIAPAAAIFAGAQWNVDGGPNENSGGIVSNLTAGNHTVSFSTIYGWMTPTNQTVSVSANSFAAPTSTYVPIPFAYTTSNGTIAITYYTGPGGALSIPTTMNGLTVTSIGDDAFESANLTSVTIPNSVTNIGVEAFRYCASLTNVTIGTNVISIGEEAFAYCSGLTSVTIPASVASIGNRAFKYCFAVTLFHFDGNAPVLGDEVFEGDFNAAICYVSDSSGWTSPFGGLRAGLCDSPNAIGSLQVTITPAGAIAAGAHWQVDTGPLQNNEATLSSLPAGNHTVSFTTVSGSGWLTPANQTVTITNGATTTASGVYTASAEARVQWARRIASTAILPSLEAEIGMTLDSQGNCYLSGMFDGTNDFGGVSLINESVGGSDVFVAKYNASGVLQWAQRAGASPTRFDYGRGVGVDNAGNVYVTGGFYGPAAFGGFNLSITQDEEFFLAKYDSTGALKWVQQSSGGNTGNVYGTGLAVDGAGNCYAVVYGGGTGATVTFGSTNVTLPFGYDESSFLVKYDSAGTVLWAQLMGGSGLTYATKAAVDAAGNAYVCGTFEDSLTIGTSNLVGSVVGTHTFIAKFDPTGVLTWIQHTEGGNAGSGGVAVDQAGNVYVASPFEFTIDFGGISLTNAANDSFVAKYSNSGAIQWARQAGGASFCEDVALDGQGNAYPAGSVSSEATVANYDPSGALQWTLSASGPTASPVSSLVAKCAVDSDGHCYLAGWYQGTATFGTNVLQPQGNWNFFLAKLNAVAPDLGGTAFSGNDLVLNGINGLSGATCYLLTSTNLALPLNRWTPVATNVLTASGGFTITATNAVVPGVPHRFYILKTQ